ncbi:MAG: TRAP transporter substrate-binding protein [Clostridiales bacterium]|nr:TRAP transporter substrate-binding protein [Clostridiales bacterium]
MKKLRKFLLCLMAAALACGMAAALTGCGDSETDTDAWAYSWALGTASPEDTVTGLYAEKFAEAVEELSGGEMAITVYHNSTLGSDTELIESCQWGDIPFVVQNTAPQVSYLPRLCLFDAPCVFSTLDELHEVLDDDTFMTKINEIYAEGGFRLLAMADQNFRVMTSNKEITSLSDFSGIKIRTMENSYHMTFWSALGANPSPMAFSELYTGLEQHTVDAQENPYEVIVSSRFYEVQKYVVETNHLPHLLSLITNEEFYQNLTAEQQEIIDEAAAIARDYAREQAIARADERIETINSSGTCQVISISDELWEEMQEQSQDLYEEIRGVVDDDELFFAYVGDAYEGE